jgi:hypothetical protein
MSASGQQRLAIIIWLNDCFRGQTGHLCSGYSERKSERLLFLKAVVHIA